MEDFKIVRMIFCLKEIRLFLKSCISNMKKWEKKIGVQDDSGYLWKISGIESNQRNGRKMLKTYYTYFSRRKNTIIYFIQKSYLCSF
ncbi:hypothetical protein M0811_07680 [Anaeramoeba ignava]|uniref:Uncharacterized protein n=1 Tax=Anaeramoeba ignava TaxID=1746090 RepID=A0A9Q0LK69_ANAIG|nr:hypothetical protein M0811_07680 [Anaeramoeba ignava]